MNKAEGEKYGKEMEQGKNLTLELHTDQDDRRPVVVVGSFNGWKIDPQRFQMEKVTEGLHRFTFPPELLPKLPFEYKYIKEGWEGEELNEYGQPISNRRIRKLLPTHIDHVAQWRSPELIYHAKYLPQIEILDENFPIPQLIKTRRISVLLPCDYYETDRHYPVLYLQDGQNLFDDYAPFGSWAVNKRLAAMAERGTNDIIIVAIDHADSERVAEFTPSYQTRLGTGEGKKYVRFLADTLKPYIDTHFRTLPDRTHTGIGGSSMGGLISIYAGLMYPEVYGKLLIFSPSLWVAPRIHFQAIQFHDPIPTRIYLYAGGRESKNMIPNVHRFKDALEKTGQDGSRVEFRLSIDPEGEHNEARWGKEFPVAIEWLFFHEKNH